MCARDGQRLFNQAGDAAIELIEGLFHPDHIVGCGGVGLALIAGNGDRGSRIEGEGTWTKDRGGMSSPPRPSGFRVPFREGAGGEGSGRVTRSPFGGDAGLYGAAALALFPPEWP